MGLGGIFESWANLFREIPFFRNLLSDDLFRLFLMIVLITGITIFSKIKGAPDEVPIIIGVLILLFGGIVGFIPLSIPITILILTMGYVMFKFTLGGGNK